MEQISIKFDEAYTSINADNSIAISNKHEIIVCLVISIFTVSLFLSFTIALYNFIPLTANANIHGMKIMFCNNIDIITNNIPFSHS